MQAYILIHGHMQAVSRFFELGIVYVVLTCPAVHAQIPHRLQRCLPYPTFAQEMERANEERNQEAPQARVVIIDDVEFDGRTHLSQAGREELVRELKRERFPADSKWIGEIEEVAVRGAWQHEGYFKASGRAKARLLYADGETQHVSLTIHVDESLQYRLAGIQFRNAGPETPTAPFSADELRKAIPMHDGEIFNTEKIRQGLEALRRLYGSKGYIDFTAEPLIDVDDALQRISLVIELDEQKQFRVGKIEILGLDPKTESLLRSKLKPGDVFNFQIVEDFYKDNKALLPPDATPLDVEIGRDVLKGIVFLFFDFRTCPPA